MNQFDRFLDEHLLLTRRFFIGTGSVSLLSIFGSSTPARAQVQQFPSELKESLEKLESLFTEQSSFGDVSRGSPVPHTLSEERRSEVGLTRETWQLEVITDKDHPSRIKQPMTRADGTALDFSGLMKLAQTQAVRFAKVMTCLNMGCPLGMGIWEGVPLREVIWKTQPVENLRRIFYYGYHNDQPKQMFRSSLPASRVLEDPSDLPPVILCYKLNGQWLTPERGGPVRIVVPEAYGFKSIKWLTHVVMTNLAVANDTYIDGNNDVDSPIKSFAATLSAIREVNANRPIPVTGYAQVGISGVRKVQIAICPKGAEPAEDPYFRNLNWVDATILDPPDRGRWGGGLPDSEIPAETIGFDKSGRPKKWPMKNGKLHWAAAHPGLPSGEYTLRTRTIDDNGAAQPMPRPFKKSGHADIEKVDFSVK